jgi:hypothetical protein
MTAPKSGPVTHGQLSVLRSLRAHGPDGQAVANLLSVWQVPLGTITAEVVDAWLRLVEVHESLRTGYDQRGTTPTQTVHPFVPMRVPTVELAEDTAAAAHQLSTTYAAEPIDIGAGVPWRAAIATYQGDPLYLITVIHHVAADNGALRILEDQFGRLLAGDSITATAQPLELALTQQDDPAASRNVRHWTEVWGQLTTEDRDPGDASERRRASLYSVHGLEAARELSARLRVSVQSVLLAVGALAVARLEQRATVTFVLMAANRLEERWAALVSSLNQYAPVTVTVDERADPLEYLRAIYVQSMNAYMNAVYSVDELTESLRRAGHEDADSTAFAKHFNFLGEVDAEPGALSPLRSGVEWRWSTQRSGPNLHLAMATGEGLLIGVGSSLDYLDGDGPAALAASIEAGLVNMAKGSASALNEVSLDPIRTF